MTQLLDGMLADLLTDDFSGFEGGNEAYQIPGEVQTLVANQWLTSREEIEIGGKRYAYTTRVRLVDPILSSMALRKTNATTMANRLDFNATVVAGRELEIEVDGKFMPIQQFALQAIRQGNPGLHRSDADILLDLKNYGWDPSGRLPMYLQHLGANQETFRAAAAHFATLGAKDNTEGVKSRARGQASEVLMSIRHDDGGVPIAQLEISHVDRSRSSNNTGFIGFFDATWNTFVKVIGMDRTRTAIRKTLAADPTNKEAAQKDQEIRELFSTARTFRAFRNWGGTTVLHDALDPTKVTYYAQQVPCGRFAVAGTGGSHTYSVWSTRAAAGGTEAMAPSEIVVPTTVASEPF